MSALMLLALCGVTASSSEAMAQEGEGEAQKRQDFTGPLKDQLAEYWSVDRDLPMIKDRLYELDDSFTLGIFGGIVPSEPFYVYAPVGGRLGYFFSNELALEVSGAYMLSFNTTLTDFLSDSRQGGFNPETDTDDRFKWNADAVISWHPLYGKWALLQRKLSHLDFSLVLGAGALGLTRPDVQRNSAESSVQPALVFGAGFGFFLHEGVLLRLDWRSRPYLGPEFETAQFDEQGFLDRVTVPSEFTLGLSYVF